MSHPLDEELIARCAAGSRQAMDMLVSRYHGRLLDFAYRHLRDRDASADIAQMTLIRVFESAGTYRRQASFRSWLYTIALNLVRDHMRRPVTRMESPASEVETADGSMRDQADAGPTVESAEDAALERIAADQLWRTVGGMPENWRSAIILRFRHELTYDEIAEVMGVPCGTVKSWVHYALKSLRERVAPVNCGG